MMVTKGNNMAKIGRPTKYTPELAKNICDAVSTHPYGLSTLVQMFDSFPTPETIRVWRLEKEEFSLMYARAKLIQADILAEHCLDIAYDCSGKESYFRSRLLIDTHKWLASKLLPKQYGDRFLVEKNKEETSQEAEEYCKKYEEKHKKEF